MIKKKSKDGIIILKTNNDIKYNRIIFIKSKTIRTSTIKENKILCLSNFPELYEEVKHLELVLLK